MYLAEFDFRYNARSGLGISDPERAGKLLKGIVGKRLTYRRADETAQASAEGETLSRLEKTKGAPQ